MAHDFYVRLTGTRADHWKEILGTDLLPVVSPIPSMTMVPGFTEPQKVFLLAINEMPVDQVMDIAKSLSARFNMSPEETIEEIRKTGIPILESGCSVVIRGPWKWF